MEEAKMGLKEKSLCCSNGWSYGVFWRFDQRNSMLLTMEDAYCEEKMQTLVDGMLQQVHIVGEGIVGQAASTGKHQWIFSDSVGNQDDSEIHRLFSHGIKTIAVTFVESQGVLQFGSSQKILESVEFLDQTKRLFDMGLTSSVNLPSSMNCESYDLNEWLASFCCGNITPMHGGSSCNELMEMACTPISITQPCSFVSGVQQESMNSLCLDSSHSTDQYHSAGAEASQLMSNQHSALPIHIHEGKLLDEQTSQIRIPDQFKPDGFTTDFFNSNVMDNLFEWLAPSSECSVTGMSTLMNEKLEQPVGVASVSSGLIGNVLVDFPLEKPSNSVQSSITETHVCGRPHESVQNNLLKGFGLEFGSGQAGVSTGVSESISEMDVSSVVAPRRALFSELGIEELLNGTSSSNYFSKSRPEDQMSVTKKRRLESSSDNISQAQPESVSCSNSSMYNLEKTINNLLSKKEGFIKSQVGSWIDDSYSINNGNTIQAKPNKKPEEAAKTTRKRARPGESTRPRPKDRQQIQDRLKELKGIIPGGEKCSIDALLDRTIKHMLFLQSVAKYADKLKQAHEPKLTGQESRRLLEGCSSGATWAMEVGDQTAVCPIRIEDVGPSGLMLIEIFCEDRGFFLELADIIRNFGLNILKGMMEVQEDKILARFVVEAHSHMTRIEIFWSLFEIIQQTTNSGMDSMNQPSNNTMNERFPFSNNYQQMAFPCPVGLAETL